MKVLPLILALSGSAIANNIETDNNKISAYLDSIKPKKVQESKIVHKFYVEYPKSGAVFVRMYNQAIA